MDRNAGTGNPRYILRGPCGEKVCTRCRVSRPLDHFKVDRSRFDGRGYICAGCRDAERRAPGPTKRERGIKASEGLKWCSGCQQWLPSVRAGRCRSCANADSRTRYNRDPAFRHRRRHRTSARRRGVEPIPPDARESIMEDFGGCCAYCPKPANSWDHVVPVTKGGLSEPYNVVPACMPCNSSKRTQNVWIWLEKTGRTPNPAFFDRLALYHASLIPPRGPDPFE